MVFITRLAKPIRFTGSMHTFIKQLYVLHYFAVLIFASDHLQLFHLFLICLSVEGLVGGNSTGTALTVCNYCINILIAYK